MNSLFYPDSVKEEGFAYCTVLILLTKMVFVTTEKEKSIYIKRCLVSEAGKR